MKTKLVGEFSVKDSSKLSVQYYVTKVRYNTFRLDMAYIRDEEPGFFFTAPVFKSNSSAVCFAQKMIHCRVTPYGLEDILRDFLSENSYPPKIPLVVEIPPSSTFLAKKRPI